MRLLARQVVDVGVRGHFHATVFPSPVRNVFDQLCGHSLAALLRHHVDTFQEHHRRAVGAIDVVVAQRGFGQTDGLLPGIVGDEVDIAMRLTQLFGDFVPMLLFRSIGPECLAQR